MKTILLHISILIIFFLLLLFPIQTLNGAAAGLLLWYQILLPTLLPFIIISTLLIKTEAYKTIYHFTGSTIGKLFQTSEGGTLAVIIGFLCGYPCGAKVINDLYLRNAIGENEAKYLLSFCNNTSPMFIISYFIYQVLNAPKLLLPTLFALYTSPIILSFITRKIYPFSTTLPPLPIAQNNNNSSCKFTFKLLDDIIFDSITLILKIGGYVMLFSIFISLSTCFSKHIMPIVQYIIPLLEITTGINIYIKLSTEIMRYATMIFLISFGGLCAVGQTKCVLESPIFKISHYLVQKIITAIIAVIISVFLFSIIHSTHHL